MRLFTFVLVVLFSLLSLTACGGSAKKSIEPDPVPEVAAEAEATEEAMEETAEGSVKEAIAEAEAEEEIAAAEEVVETGALQSNFKVVDDQGRVSGTLSLTPFGGAELRDLEGNLIGVLTKPEVTPANAPAEAEESVEAEEHIEEVEDNVYKVDLDEDDAEETADEMQESDLGDDKDDEDEKGEKND